MFSEFVQKTAPLSFRPSTTRKSKEPWGQPHYWRGHKGWLCYPERFVDDASDVFVGRMVSPNGAEYNNCGWAINELSLEPSV